MAEVVPVAPGGPAKTDCWIVLGWFEVDSADVAGTGCL